MPTISIIVPVYNCAKYLRRCVDSIIGQTLTDWELLLVDDGSNDISGIICDEYSAADNRIRTIHQPNSGVGAARNRGLDEAKGEYITFVDADDWIDSECLEKTVSDMTVNDCDMLKSGFKVKDENNEVVRYYTMPRKSFDTVVFLASTPPFLFTVWGGACRRKIIASTGIRFNEKMRYGEDVDFTMRLLLHTRRVMTTEDVFYNYFLINENNASHSKKKSSELVYILGRFNELARLHDWCARELVPHKNTFLSLLLANHDISHIDFHRLFNETTSGIRLTKPNMIYSKIASVSSFVAFHLWGRLYSLKLKIK